MADVDSGLLIRAAARGLARFDFGAIARASGCSERTVRSAVIDGRRGTPAADRVLAVLGLEQDELGASETRENARSTEPKGPAVLHFRALRYRPVVIGFDEETEESFVVPVQTEPSDHKILLSKTEGSEMWDEHSMRKAELTFGEDGSAYCECGGNLFRRAVGNPSHLVCNGCQGQYTGE